MSPVRRRVVSVIVVLVAVTAISIVG